MMKTLSHEVHDAPAVDFKHLLGKSETTDRSITYLIKIQEIIFSVQICP